MLPIKGCSTLNEKPCHQVYSIAVKTTESEAALGAANVYDYI